MPRQELLYLVPVEIYKVVVLADRLKRQFKLKLYEDHVDNRDKHVEDQVRRHKRTRRNVQKLRYTKSKRHDSIVKADESVRTCHVVVVLSKNIHIVERLKYFPKT